MTIKKSFTLLEIMIALVILTFIGTVTTIYIKKLINAHRFESEVSDLFIAIQEAQVLSAAFQTDLSLDFFQKKGIFYYRISTDEPLTLKQLNQGDFILAHTASLLFKDAKVKKLHFDIFSGGRIEPGGILTFCQSQEEDTKELWFDLQHGHLLKFAYNKPSLATQKLPQVPINPKGAT